MDLHQQLRNRQILKSIAKSYPLALARLWVPHCHRFDGMGDQSPRPKGCKKPMTRIGPSYYECSTCNIKEKRTSQQEAILNLGEISTAIFGGNRSGKTEAVCQLACAVSAGRDCFWVREWLRLNNLPDSVVPNRKGGTVIVSALSYSDALTYIRPKINKYLPHGTRFIRWNSQDRGTALLPSGGKIYSMSADSGRAKYQGVSADLVILDEEHNYDLYEEASMRTIDTKGKIVLSMTPLLGFTWPAAVFIQDPQPGFVHHKISGLDNPYISSSRMMKTIAHMSDESKQSRLHGDFTNQAGLIYSEFDRNVHIYKEDIELNRDKHDVYVSIDFGVVHPFCALLIIHGPEDTLYVVDEYYKTERTTLENGRALKHKFRKYMPFDFVVCDPESKDGRLLLAKECQLQNKPSPKHIGVVATINMVKERLLINETTNKPKLFIHPRCKNLLLEFRKYRWSKTLAKDKPIKAHDHALDSLRYAICFINRKQAHL
jgi:phage terminase large subunit-like protein